MRVSVVLMIAGFFIGSLSCTSEKDSAAKGSLVEKKRVRLTRAIEGNLPLTISVSGTLAAEEEVRLSMKVGGRIQSILVDLGSMVRQGQPLVRLEPSDFQLRVKQAEAAYQQARVRLGLPAEADGQDGSTIDPEETGVVRQARAVLQEATLTRNRMKALHDDGLIARSQMDDAEAAFQVADARYQDALEEVRTRQAILIQRRAELDLARKQLSDSVLLAPMSGGIAERLVSPGQFVAVGDHVMTLVRMHPLRLKLSVPERNAVNIRQGQTVQIRLEGNAKVHTGRLARVSPAISHEDRTLLVEAEIPNPDGLLRPGSFARAEIIVASDQPAILVPEKSVVTFAGITKVLSVDQDQTVEKRVKIGRRSGELVEVIEGISAGEPVVVDPGNLVGGQTVSPIW